VNELIHVIEEWDVLEDYAGEKLGFYQLIENDGSFEIRVQTGQVGFIKDFENQTDELLNRILSFCRRHRYIKVNQTASDEPFFK